MSINILFPLSNLYNPSLVTNIKTNLPSRDSSFCDSNFAIDLKWHVKKSISATNSMEFVFSTTLFLGEILRIGSPNSFNTPISKSKLLEYANGSKYPVYFGQIFTHLKHETNEETIFELQINFETSSTFNFFNSHWSGSGLSYEFQNYCFFVTVFNPISMDTSSSSLDDSLLYIPIITRCSPTFRMKSETITPTLSTGKLRYTEINFNIQKFSDPNRLQYELQQPLRHRSAPCLGQRNRIKTRECLRRLEDIYSNDSIVTRKRTKSYASLDQHVVGNIANKLPLLSLTNTSTAINTTINNNTNTTEDTLSKCMVRNQSSDRAEGIEEVDTNTIIVGEQLFQLRISTDVQSTDV